MYLVTFPRSLIDFHSDFMFRLLSSIFLIHSHSFSYSLYSHPSSFFTQLPFLTNFLPFLLYIPPAFVTLYSILIHLLPFFIYILSPFLLSCPSSLTFSLSSVVYSTSVFLTPYPTSFISSASSYYSCFLKLSHFAHFLRSSLHFILCVLPACLSPYPFPNSLLLLFILTLFVIVFFYSHSHLYPF